jgi:hypothetical protein
VDRLEKGRLGQTDVLSLPIWHRVWLRLRRDIVCWVIGCDPRRDGTIACKRCGRPPNRGRWR